MSSSSFAFSNPIRASFFQALEFPNSSRAQLNLSSSCQIKVLRFQIQFELHFSSSRVFELESSSSKL